MQEKKLEVYLYFVLLAAALYLVWKILSPYIFAIGIAVIFAVMFFPLHKKVLRRMPKYNSLAALCTLLILCVLVLLPLVMYGIQFSDEVKNFYDYAFTAMQGEGLMARLTAAANNTVVSLSPLGIEWPVFDVSATESYVFTFLSWIRGHFGDIFSGLAKFFMDVLVFLFALYYFLRDGESIKDNLIKLSPFSDDKDEAILGKLRMAVVSVIKGSMIVALVQGFMTGFGFYLFGISSAFLWGGVTVIAALVPAVGTSLVIVPGIIYLFFIGAIPQGIGLIFWGIFSVGLIDNILGPKLMERGIKIHPLLILLSALGGISYFGPIGFVFGPVVLSFLFALFDIYKTSIVKEKALS